MSEINTFELEPLTFLNESPLVVNMFTAPADNRIFAPIPFPKDSETEPCYLKYANQMIDTEVSSILCHTYGASQSRPTDLLDEDIIGWLNDVESWTNMESTAQPSAVTISQPPFQRSAFSITNEQPMAFQNWPQTELRFDKPLQPIDLDVQELPIVSSSTSISTSSTCKETINQQKAPKRRTHRPTTVIVPNPPEPKPEKILGELFFGGEHFFFVKWQGQPGCFNSWTLRSHLRCMDLILSYRASLKKK